MLERDADVRLIQDFFDAATRRHHGSATDAATAGAECRRLDEIIRAAQNQSRNDTNLFRRKLEETPAIGPVLARLMACSPRRPCASAACNNCNTGLTETATPLIADLVEQHPGPWWCVTIIQTRPTIRQGELADHDLFVDLRAKLHHFFADQGAIAIGSLEISCNEHHAHAHWPRYVEHAHLLTQLAITKPMRRQLLKLFPRTKGVKRPIKVQQYDRDAAAVDYDLKPHVERRIQLPGKRPDGTRSIFSTRKKPLRGRQRVEVAISMNRLRPADRLFLHGVSAVRTRDRVRLRFDEDE